MNGKIAITALLSLLFSFSLLIIFVNFYPDNITKNENQFYNEKINPEESRIFILGASGIGTLNSTMINQEISKLSNEHVVYNLSKGGDLPEKRIHTLNEIVNQKPKLIIYGIDFRDFEEEKNNNLLMSPNQFFENLVPIDDYNLDIILFNPRLVTQQAIQKIGITSGLFTDKQELTKDYTPLILLENLYEITSNEKLMNQYEIAGSIGLKIDDSTNNKNLKSLEKMINVFQENNINIVIITIPHHKVFFNGLDQNEERKFQNILRKIEDKYGIEIHFINHKYENLPIWANVNHIAFHKDSKIYTEDITKIILNELN